MMQKSGSSLEDDRMKDQRDENVSKAQQKSNKSFSTFEILQHQEEI